MNCMVEAVSHSAKEHLPGLFIKETGHLNTHIVGYEQAKQFLHENVVLPLTVSEKQYDSLFHGIRSRSNVLLFGPPGSGKSCLVRTAANQAGVPLHTIYPSDILSKYQGDSERSLSQLFERSSDTKDAKRILFFDGAVFASYLL